MIPWKQVVKRAGGEASIVRACGYPVNKFTVGIWRRNGYVPHEFRPVVADLIGVKPEELEPDADEKAMVMRYKAVALAYRSMAAACGANSRTLAKLHNMPAETVALWRDGYEEAPLSAFVDLYCLVTGKMSKRRAMTIDNAMKMLGMGQSELCLALKVNPSMGTYWKNKGDMGPKWADRVIKMVAERAS